MIVSAGIYDFDSLEGVTQAITDIDQESNTALEIVEDVLNIDPRVLEYFEDFNEIKKKKRNLSDSHRDIGQAYDYFDESVEDANTTNERKKASNPERASTGSGDVGKGGGTGPGASADATKIDSKLGDGTNNINGVNYSPNPETWANLPSGEKETFIKKLKQVGYTDEEIQKIINGEVPVSKLKLEKLASDLEALYKKDPSIRQKIKDLYGIDIFNDDGTINKDKLALAMILDQKNPNDQYDLEKLIAKLKPEEAIGSKTGTEPTTTPQIKPQTVPSTTPQTAPIADTEKAATPVTEEKIEGIVTGGAVAAGTMGAANAAEAVAETIATEQEKDLASLLGDLTGSVGNIGKAITPTGGSIETNKGGAGIITAAGLAAAGAIGGGGVYARHNLMTLTFSPDDFNELNAEDRAAIEKDMRGAGYTEEEIAKFKESDFSVDDSFITDIGKAIKKAVEINEKVKEQIREKYGYDIIDALNKISKYKVFVTSIIDGKNALDDYNIYNILNPILTETKLTNLTYFGLILEEVIITEETAKRLGIMDKLGRTYKFSREDYEGEDDYTKSAIVSTLTAAGLSGEEIEKIKTSTFKIKVGKMNPIIEKLEKINEEQSNFAQKLTDMYKYSLIDAEGKVDKYRLFVAMIIDGVGKTDEYNIYKIMEEATGEKTKEEAEYKGIKIEEVIVEKKEEPKEIKIEQEELEEEGFQTQDTPKTTNAFLEEYSIE